MAKNDFLLNIGFKIDTKSISKGALRNALNKAAANLTLKISKVKLANPQQMRRDIAAQLGAVQLANLSVSSNAAKSLARSIQDKTKPTIKSLSVNPTSLANLRKSVERALSNVSVSVQGVGGGGGAPRQQGASSGGVGSNTRATRGNTNAIEQRKQALIETARVERKALEAMTRTERAQLRLSQSLRQSGLSAQELGVKIGQVAKRFGEYAASVALVRTAQQTLRTAAEGVVQLDSAIQDLAKVGSVTKDINQGFRAVTGVALATGRSIDDVSDAIGEFVRQGKNLTEASKAAANALQLSNISALNGADAARIVTAAQQVFGSTSEELSAQLSSLAVFADSSATNVTEIGQAFLRAASSAKTGGFDLEETFAVLAATLEQTRLQSATVGTALKTIVARLGRDRKQVAALANSFTGLTKGQEGFVDSSGTVADILNQLAQNSEKLTLQQKQQLALQVAGVRQGNVFIGFLDNYAKSQELVNNRQADSSAINEKNEAQLRKLSTRFANLTTAVKAFAGATSGLEGGNQTGISALVSDTTGSLTEIISVIPKAITSANSLFKEFELGTVAGSAIIGAVVGPLQAIGSVALQSAAKFAVVASKGKEAGAAIVDGMSKASNATDQQTKRVNTQISAFQRLKAAVRGVGNAPTSLRGEVTGGELKGAAVRGAVGFAATEAAAQQVEIFTKSLKEANEAAIELGKSAPNSKELVNALDGASSQVRTAGLIFQTVGVSLKSSGIVALILGLAASAKVVKGILDDISDTQADIALQAATRQTAAFQTQIAIAGRNTEDLIKNFNRLTDETANRIKNEQDFANTLKEASDRSKEAVSKLQASLEGLDPQFASLLTRSKELDQSLSGFTFGGENPFVTNAETIRQALSESTIDLGSLENLSNDQIVNQLKADQAARVANFTEQKQLADKNLKALEAVRNAIDISGPASSSAGNVARALEGFASEQRAFASRVFAASNNTTQVDPRTGQTTATPRSGADVIETLNSQITKLDREVEGALTRINQINEQGTKSINRVASVFKDLSEDAKKNFLEQAAIQQRILLFANQTKDVADIRVKQAEKLVSEAKEEAAFKARIAQLESGSLKEQKAAVVLAKQRSLIEGSEQLKDLDERIAGLKAVNASESDILEIQKQRAQIVSTLGKVAQIDSQSQIRDLEEKAASDAVERASKQIEDANKKVSDSDQKRVEALSKLQDANKKVLNSERELSSASEDVDKAFLTIADAQRQLSQAVLAQAVQIRNSVASALSGAGFENLTRSGEALTQIVSLEQRLSVIRKEGLEESLRIAQEQAGTLLGIGERIATGGPGARAEVQRGLSVAQAIQGGASVSSFSPEDISRALQSADLFPGLKENIQRQALASVGLEDELNQLRGTIATGAEEQAREATKEQIRVAEANLAATLDGLVKAENLERIAGDDLKLAQDQAKFAQSGLDVARAQVVLQERILSETAFQNRNLLELRSSLSGGRVGNAARGTLSGGEVSGLISAAKREKSLMPAGSKLMLANTSETVLTAKQSRRLGIGARSQANAANGNGDFTGLVATMNSLLSEIRSLRSDVQSNGVSNVSLQVDTNKNINVKGIEGLSQRLQSELQGKFASGNDINAVESAILDIISKLGENGLADDLGR